MLQFKNASIKHEAMATKDGKKCQFNQPVIVTLFINISLMHYLFTWISAVTLASKTGALPTLTCAYKITGLVPVNLTACSFRLLQILKEKVVMCHYVFILFLNSKRLDLSTFRDGITQSSTAINTVTWWGWGNEDDTY